ncbi:hypothetical protein [Paenibacillus lemnae]|uniref:WXG100 family type VII secretion target n=1 Tax=Paenibacillus lemnae TaxID=1330551 RepID=A0A848M204_PAELE|nr:hypothetical protein [Paenibacillus lemnae]NMO94998.1 hypothetical protein [Paenibacillus lemnae]
MTKILVPPEVLIQVSQQFHQASLQFEWTVNNLNHQMDTMLLWEGTTRQRFYADYDRARLDLKRVIELMESVSVELKGISIKFRLLDEEVSSQIASSGRSETPPEPKTWQDHAEGLWEGVKTGGKNIADSIVSTGEALVEDPIGTIGDMAYNATIGTVEEVIDTTVWGAKMALDVGDTREKFEESVEEAGGRDQYIGQQGVRIASDLFLRRLGLKDHEGSSGGGSSKGTEGTPKAHAGYTGGRTQKELDDLAGDPSHSGKIRNQGLKEREVGLDLEQQGKLGKIVRDPQGNGGAEFIDTTNNVKWDVKSFVSYPNGHTSPRKGAFTVNNGMKAINKELDKNYNVIVDKRDMVPEHVEQLKEAIKKAGLLDRIIWYP